MFAVGLSSGGLLEPDARPRKAWETSARNVAGLRFVRHLLSYSLLPEAAQHHFA